MLFVCCKGLSKINPIVAAAPGATGTKADSGAKSAIKAAKHFQSEC